MQLQESGEMYLECILRLSREIGNVRSIDIGEYRGFSKPSISRAMKHLKEGGFINVDENGFITLTESGRAVNVSKETTNGELADRVEPWRKKFTSATPCFPICSKDWACPTTLPRRTRAASNT